MKITKTIILSLIFLAIKYNIYSQACNQSTLVASYLYTVNANLTGNVGGNYDICPGKTVYDTLQNSIMPLSNVIVRQNSKFVFKPHLSNTAIYALSNSTVVLKAGINLFGSSSQFTFVVEPGATIVNQTTLSLAAQIQTCSIIQTPSAACPVLGIDEKSNNIYLVNAFPNPFTDELTIEVNEPSQITITNSLGQVVKTLNVNGKTTLDTNDLPKALYNFSIITQNGSRNIKLIKK